MLVGVADETLDVGFADAQAAHPISSVSAGPHMGSSDYDVWLAPAAMRRGSEGDGAAEARSVYLDAVTAGGGDQHVRWGSAASMGLALP
jgi:hypothetical protein